MRNNQKPIKKDMTMNGVTAPLRIKEVFHTLQGEGPYQGFPASFIRLGGCNLQCTWCDTDYTKDLSARFVDDLIEEVKQNDLIIITGGEPFAQNITPLVTGLLAHEHLVQIETNGTLSSPDFPWEAPGLTIVCSPKSGKLHKDIVENCIYYKYVIGAEDKDSPDGMPVGCNQPKGFSAPVRCGKGPRIYLSPRDDEDEVKNQANLMTAYHLVVKHGHVLTYQLHKILGVR